ncbi:MAG: pentapeptide repeat-containing protein [Gloeotrichia echinulata IR180]|jgi:hypothetical protein
MDGKITYATKLFKIILEMWRVIMNGYQNGKILLPRNKNYLPNIDLGIITSRRKIKKTKFPSPKQRLKIAFEQLDNHQNLETSLTAIDDLEQIALEYPQFHWIIMDNLTMFVRNHAPYQPQTELKPNTSLGICQDIQAALTVIARRDINQDPENEQLDLSHTDMSGVNLSGANLEKANLYQSNLSGAELCGANLSGVILTAANLKGANLSGANLHGTILSAANLSDANLSDANLYQANLYLATLYGAILDNTIFSGANLRESKFSDVDIPD